MRTHLRVLAPFASDGSTVPDGSYSLQVDGSQTVGLVAAHEPTEGAVELLLLPTGSDAGDVPGGTPVNTIVLVKA